jgi:hypothetical protein
VPISGDLGTGPALVPKAFRASDNEVMGLFGQDGADSEPRRKRRTYTEAEIEHALAALAAVDGHVRRASRVLADRGVEVP